MHQRLIKRAEKPASGPDCSVPATGWAGTRRACAGSKGSRAEITAPLTDPTSETIAPTFKALRDRLPDRLVGADGGAKNDAIGVSDRACSRSRVVSSPSARCFRSLQDLLRSIRQDNAARRCPPSRRARDRRADQPDANNRQLVEDRFFERRPEPLNHFRARMNSASAATTPQFASSLPTVIRRQFGSPYAATARKMKPRTLRKLVRLLRPLRRPSKRSRRKLPTLGVTPIPSAEISRLSQGSHRALCAIALSICAASARLATPAANAGPLTIERDPVFD